MRAENLCERRVSGFFMEDTMDKFEAPTIEDVERHCAWIEQAQPDPDKRSVSGCLLLIIRDEVKRLREHNARQAEALDKFKDLYAEGLTVGQKMNHAKLARVEALPELEAELQRFREREALVQRLIEYIKLDEPLDPDDEVKTSWAIEVEGRARAVRDHMNGNTPGPNMEGAPGNPRTTSIPDALPRTHVHTPEAVKQARDAVDEYYRTRNPNLPGANTLARTLASEISRQEYELYRVRAVLRLDEQRMAAQCAKLKRVAELPHAWVIQQRITAREAAIAAECARELDGVLSAEDDSSGAEGS